MRSLGTPLHQDCNAMWRCKNLSSRFFYFKLEERRKEVRRYDTTRPWGFAQLRGSTKSRKERVRPKVRKDRVCIFVVWQDEMKMRCCLSIYPGVSRTYTPRRSFHLRYPCISVHPPSLLNDILGGRDLASLEMHLQAEIEWTERCTWRPWSIEFGDALGGRDRASLEMHL